jgi:signal transduction histidine kinase
VDLAALARELVELYRPEAATREITLEYNGADSAPTHGNSQLLAQVLVNLIENAIKYVSPNGRIDVSVASEPDGIVLQVADNGPGIPASDRQRILQPFVRLERDREQVGSGLGLSLVAAVMRLHRGTIELLDNHPGLIARCKLPQIAVPGEKYGETERRSKMLHC